MFDFFATRPKPSPLHALRKISAKFENYVNFSLAINTMYEPVYKGFGFMKPLHLDRPYHRNHV